MKIDIGENEIAFGMISLNDQFYEVVEAKDVLKDDILLAKTMMLTKDGETDLNYLIMKRGRKAS